MYSTINAKLQNITWEDILQKTSEYDIYRAYLGDFKIGQIYKSPFRKDNNPSFGIFVSRKNTLLFKDHGTGICGDVIKFAGLMTGQTKYNDILVQIYKDLNLENKRKIRLSAKKDILQPKETVIGIVRQPFTEVDITFWNKFGIRESTLKKFNVFSIKYYLCNGIVKGIYRLDNPMFAYKVFDKFKIYRPLGDKYIKWRSNLTEFDIQGFEQLPEIGDTLFITKSLKDIMTLYEMGYYAISPASESTFIPNTVVEAILKRFKRVIILFDRDAAGMIQSRKYSRKTGLEAMFVHKMFKAKDISDAVVNTSLKEVKTWLKKTLKQ